MSKFFNINDAHVEEQITCDVGQHRVLVSFNGDVQAEAFIDWLDHHGYKDFQRWTEVHGEDYE
jgi:hypothetical protein